MESPMSRVVQALDRFHAARPWDHNAHYHRWLLRRLPRRFGRALDVGSGSGDLARLLAGRATSVEGIDNDPDVVARARDLTAPALPVVFTVQDAAVGLPSGPYDVITCVAALHHLPFPGTLARFRGSLTPGGTLVVVGVARAETFVDHALGALAIPMNVVMALVRNRGRRVARPASMTARTRPAVMSFAEIARDARDVLPGARLRRRLFWRWTLVWQQG
ncbi:class I SAM-dependent methyltransferase [Streptomyces sp. NPDC053728]|uniref:class I SAM-dependent methyltransferase n=1 Tax=Streptomyces sp. NPDC053728 TaxID=3155534 RepID=UPI00341B3C8A